TRPSVVLDPGHGGSYPGAVNCHFHFAGRNCMREADLNLDIALKAAKLLRGRGFQVVMTRNRDTDVNASHTNIATHNQKHDGSYVFKKDHVYDLKDELQARVNIANCGTVTACPPGDPQQADAFLSIHNNSCSCKARGTTTFENRSGRLAKLVQREVLDHIGLPNRGVQQAGYYVIKWTRMPAALLEGAFMSDPHEAKLLHRATFRRKIAKGIAAGVAAFLAP
ncbi:MAG: N-acetylmuramoyl-L-alanine amidase, partial [Actinomycetota bacterium]|nr:N-acetylmuramoyl-L-alanine amidase [Actinomycetota bacterium]